MLTSDLLRAAADADQPRLLIDLGMPRNIDHAVAELPGIELLDIETIAKHAPVAELTAAAEAQDIVRDAAAEFSASRAERDALPALLALRTHVMGILEDELCRARAASGSTAPSAASGTGNALAAAASAAARETGLAPLARLIPAPPAAPTPRLRRRPLPTEPPRSRPPFAGSRANSSTPR